MAKRMYSAPTLVVHGRVEEITQGNTLGTSVDGFVKHDNGKGKHENQTGFNNGGNTTPVNPPPVIPVS